LVFEAVKKKSLYPFLSYLADRLGLTEVIFLHGHTTAPLTYILHSRQLVFANMFGIRLRCSAEAALGFIVTGVAKMAGCIGNCAAIFTCVRH
jgi:hypothetical protein